MENRINIGAPSLVLLFLVLCLSAFGLLALSSAQSDLSMAQRGAQSVRDYYQADQKGQQWVQQMSQRMDEIHPSTDIPMERGQALHIELSLNSHEQAYEVEAWYVYNQDSLEIDTSLPVWDGEELP